MSDSLHKRSAQRWRLGSLMTVGALLALASFWLVQVINRGELPGGADAPRGEPDYIVEKFSFVRMTLDGKPRYIVSGATLTHRPDGDVSDIDRPIVQSLSPLQPPTTVTANTARIVKSSNVVDLHGNVIIARPASAAGAQMRLSTEALTILTDLDQMKTAAPVAMVSGTTATTTVTGVGMFADNASRRLDIASKVHIIYPPAPRR